MKHTQKINKKANKLNVKVLAFGLLAALVVVTAGYKYYEWNTLNNLTTQYNKTWNEELALNETISKTTNDLDVIMKEGADEEASPQETNDKILSNIKLLIDQAKQYEDLIKENKKAYESMNTSLLMGEHKKFADEITKTQIDYYTLEEKRLSNTLALTYTLYNVFTSGKDGLIMQEFTANATGPEYYADNISELVSLKKYTQDDFTFTYQEEIQKNHPKGSELLEKIKSLYSIFYEIAEDFARGDEESAAYKATKMQEIAIDLNIDPDELMKETLDKELEDVKASLAIGVKQIERIKNYEENGMPKYPLLPQLKTFEEDLALCALYNLKSSLYHLKLEEYPKAKNEDELLKELNALAPRTDALDKRFDKNALTFTNSDEKITFSCSDKAGKNTYKLDTTKQDETK